MAVQGIAANDFQGLNELKVQAKNNAKEGLPEAAKLFETVFLQSMLKSRCIGQYFLDESTSFNEKNPITFQEILDGRYGSALGESKETGSATRLANQLDASVGIPLNSSSHSSNEMNSATISNTEISSSIIDDFVRSVWPIAKQAASLIGLDPKLLIAQAALETGWGKFVVKDTNDFSSNNLFNIKATANSQSESVQIKTTEYIADMPIKVNASFRKYSSIKDSFHDYISLIKESERYRTALANAANPELYMNELSKAGYATDPNYTSKILSIYHGKELKQAILRCELSAHEN
ncbi:flagellar rod assembly protein FlgJ [Legionella norrlandica]|uniref:Flagellar rod assembly protein FlgJ n=1 Tax=Legionella norrlandica TaxID=1498499 RepID=A0A0A2STY2_9GAMM|nr:glucosaminidase domain-containing protein [Legionella norrlandica]KGP62859.1 flagellar rod assembly protein FlgJ [Legionella norrlandica]